MENLYDKYLTNFLKKGTYTPYMKGFLKKNLEPFLPKNKTCSMLDVGVGKGKVILFLKEIGYDNLYGVDISPESYEYIIENSILPKERIMNADIFDYFKKINRKFDVIICKDFLEHLSKEKIIVFLQLSREHLKKNGKLWITVPNLQNFILGTFIFYDDFTHKTGFTENSLRQVISSAGFNKITLYQEKQPIIFDTLIFFLGSFVSAILNNLAQVFIKFFYILHFRFPSPKIFTPNIIVVVENK